MTDHVIPGPGDTPGTSWPLTDTGGIDWNNAARTTVITGLKLVPEGGAILSALAGIFWPKDQPSPWDQVKAQTEALVNQKISDLVYQQVSDDLKGLNNNVTDYLNAVIADDPVNIQTQWILTQGLFHNALPHFQSPGYELPLLGLFAQFANMYLALLRDVVINGKSWGRNEIEQQQDISVLKKNITDFTEYANKTYKAQRAYLLYTVQPDNSKCEPFTTINAYERGMTLTVLDYVTTWQYYDVTQYPNGTDVVLTREIYADPLGTCIDSGPIILPSPPTQGPTNLSVWGDTYLVDAVQLTYPAGSGPGGVTQTARMGNPDHYQASTQPPSGGSFTISPNNPIIQFRGSSGSYKGAVDALQFRFYDGTTTSILGGNAPSWLPDFPTYIKFPDELMSSIHINGISTLWGVADCAVVGFKYWQSPAATLNAIQTMYVKSPKEHSLADFAKAYPNLAFPAALFTDELKAARAAYWADIQARAKASK